MACKPFIPYNHSARIAMLNHLAKYKYKRTHKDPRKLLSWFSKSLLTTKSHQVHKSVRSYHAIIYIHRVNMQNWMHLCECVNSTYLRLLKTQYSKGSRLHLTNVIVVRMIYCIMTWIIRLWIWHPCKAKRSSRCLHVSLPRFLSHLWVL